ncbi:ATP-binding protein [Dactylosporangium sp. CA-139066]|uniref:ATP-binding protein n=1 Tax=Dactylosporangium sp. CA-139066 TaxID=3239930 RepID=UPI003D8BDF6D
MTDSQPSKLRAEHGRAAPDAGTFDDAGTAPDRSTAPGVAVDLEQPFTVGDLYGLRAAVEAHAAGLGASQAAIEILLIVVGELSSNAVQHGGGAGRLMLWQDGADLMCRVSDHGHGMTNPDQAGRVAVPPTALSGRGLWMVRQLTRHLHITAGTHGTTVTARIVGELPSSSPPATMPERRSRG